MEGEWRNAKVLIVGAGGIGCELLKNVVLCGFRNVNIVDLDTIDKSNLNRQFLFRRENVGQAKAEVAAQVIRNLKNDIDITPLCANIKELPLQFYDEFQLIFNALDNLDARRHVNRISIAKSIPLIDAGTQGLNGQVSSHIPRKTACYECEPKATPKTFPVCTIRSVPDKPIHCITWAKYLFEILFGQEDEGNVLSDFMELRDKSPEELCEFLFKTEIMTQEERNVRPLECGIQGHGLDELNEPTIEQCKEAFCRCTSLLRTRGLLTFNKDDWQIIEFISAASNLRSFNFFIPLLSPFKIKEMAGNIVPAVASTNAIAAGLQVIQGIRVLQGKEGRNVWILKEQSADRMLLAGGMPGVNRECYACGNGQVQVMLDTGKALLSMLVKDVLQGRLSMICPSILKDGNIMYEEGDGLEEDELEVYQANAQKTLRDLQIENGAILLCDVRLMQDVQQDCKLNLMVVHTDTIDEQETPEGFILQNYIPQKTVERASDKEEASMIPLEDEEIVEIIEVNSLKRPASPSIYEPVSKLPKVTPPQSYQPAQCLQQLIPQPQACTYHIYLDKLPKQLPTPPSPPPFYHVQQPMRSLSQNSAIQSTPLQVWPRQYSEDDKVAANYQCSQLPAPLQFQKSSQYILSDSLTSKAVKRHRVEKLSPQSLQPTLQQAPSWSHPPSSRATSTSSFLLTTKNANSPPRPLPIPPQQNLLKSRMSQQQLSAPYLRQKFKANEAYSVKADQLSRKPISKPLSTHAPLNARYI